MDINSIFSQAFVLDENTKKNISILQSDEYFHLRLFKENRFKNLQKFFLKQNKIKVLISKKFSKSLNLNANLKYDISYIDDNFFSDEHPLTSVEKIEYLEGKVLLFNSHMPQWGGVTKSLMNFLTTYVNVKNCAFVAWDWDNHHTLHISSIICAGSDIYCHAHFSHDYELSVYCDRRFRVPATTFQWNEYDIVKNIKYLINLPRSNEPLGRHVKYGLFLHREKVLTTLSQKYLEIGLLEKGNDYFDINDFDRLKQWAGHKVHWIVPTLNDVPCRIFDALITGGIPILPYHLRNDLVLTGLSDQDCEFYTSKDIIDSDEIVSSAIQKFNQNGLLGILRRINFVLTNHTFSSRIGNILNNFESTIFDKLR